MTPPPSPSRLVQPVPSTAIPLAAFLLLTATAGLGWAALVTDFVRSIGSSLAKGISLGEALFRFFRFFTILTNIGVATLMSSAAWRLWRGRPLPPAAVFNAALVYIFVTCVTYETILRRTWSPQGLQFVTDTIVHDVVPALTFIVWIFCAPHAGARWRDAAWGLAYPAIFLVLTLVAGALGEGYPYGFLDVDAIGMVGVLEVAGIFLAIFYLLGLLVTAIARKRAAQSLKLPAQIAA